MGKRKRITITDVARLAGVSKQTVSRVINDRPDVADQTRSRVKAVIDKLNYSPDPIARSMKGLTHTFGLITPNLLECNFSSIVQAAQMKARENGYFILTGSAEVESEVPPLLNEMIDRRIDGLLIINPRDDGRYHYLSPLFRQNIPIVYIKNTPLDPSISAVCLDNTKGGYLATHHLIESGHTEIAMIQGPPNEERSQNRRTGFGQAFQEANLLFNPGLILQGDWTAKSGQTAVENALAHHWDFTALFAQNDRMAVGAIHAIRQAGRQVPKDISVIGYDDILLASYIDPPLTTIHQPFEEFGRLSAELLIEAVTQDDFQPRVVQLDPKLIIRDSCCSLG